MAQTQHERVAGKPLLNFTEQLLTKPGLNQSELSGSQCVLEKIAEKSNLNLPETPASGEENFSPPASPTRPDNTHYQF
jgi:hypothetical protein